MSSSTQPDGTAHVGAYIPTNHAEAIFQISKSRSTRSDRVSQSDVLRDAIREYLQREAENEDLPGEVLDLLDEDLKANAGGNTDAPESVGEGSA